MGVHRFTQILAFIGDMGWITSTHRRWVSMISLWNRLVSMDTSRLTRIVFEYDHGFFCRNWCSDIKKILEQVDFISSFNTKSLVNLKDVEDRLFSKYKLEWANKIQSVSKLRTYRQIKTDFGTENYLLSTLSKDEKSFCSALRKQAYSNILKILPPKNENFQIKKF